MDGHVSCGAAPDEDAILIEISCEVEGRHCDSWSAAQSHITQREIHDFMNTLYVSHHEYDNPAEWWTRRVQSAAQKSLRNVHKTQQDNKDLT